MENAIEQQLLAATQMIEQQVDAEIQNLDKMDEDDFEALRRKRLEGLKKAQHQKDEWLQNGHGKYEEIGDEKEFFSACKKSKNMVCHFYRNSTFYCKIIDKHLTALAAKHLETRFVKIDAERSKFLSERLRIKVMPTVCLVKDGKTVDYVVGLDDLGGKEDFPTEMMEWRIAQAGVINYSGDLSTPPVAGAAAKKTAITKASKKTIRGKVDDDDDDDDD